MINNVTVPEALEYKSKISAVDGVSSVTWLDDSIDITEPLETADSKAVENYYKDNSALISITIDEDHILDAVSEIRNIVGSDNKDEVAELNDGVTKIDDGANSVSDDSDKLKDGGAKLSKGSSQLSDGAKTLDNGITKLSSGVSSM